MVDRPLQEQERRVLNVLRSRPEWRVDELLDELSRGRRLPFTDRLLHAYVHKLRARGHAITFRRTVALAPRR